VIYRLPGTRCRRSLSFLSNVVDNAHLQREVTIYELPCFLQEISDTQRGDMGYKSNGYLKQLSTFLFFSLKMLYAVFARSESLAQAVQYQKLSLAKADSMVKALSSMWNSDRCDSRFAVLWDTVVREADSLGVEPPVMPRVRRLPRRIDDGSLQHDDQQVEDVYRRLYFSSLDAAITCLSSRFQSAFELARNTVRENVCNNSKKT